MDYFGYYSLLVPFVDAYYRLDAWQSAQKLATKVAFKYRDELEYFKSLSQNEQFMMGEEIITQVERYRTLVEAILVNEDRDLSTTELDYFTSSVLPFKNLYGDYDYYTSLNDFVEGYYLSDQPAKAEELVDSIVSQYEERFEMISKFSKSNDS